MCRKGCEVEGLYMCYTEGGGMGGCVCVGMCK